MWRFVYLFSLGTYSFLEREVVMNLLLKKSPEVFQGESFLTKNINYFEGWYFKNCTNDFSIAFIPGIQVDEKGKSSFIQVITKNTSYYITYPIEDFHYSYQPFFIKIGENIFSKESMKIHISSPANSLFINGELLFHNSQNIKTSFFSPNIMGPFCYVPFMECSHAILSMQHEINGFLNFNGDLKTFHSGIGYIEKDWGTSFPSSYCWCQGNHFLASDASFFASVATIPKPFPFQGFIASFLLNGIEHRFASYNNSKIRDYQISENSMKIVFHHHDEILTITSFFENGLRLVAPVKGKMEKDILESISSCINVQLIIGSKVVFDSSSSNCGLEIVT